MAIVYSKRPTGHVKRVGILNQVSAKTILGMGILFSNKSYDICILHFLPYVTFTGSLATFSRANYCLDSRVLHTINGN